MFGVCFSIPAHYRRIGLKFLHITHTQARYPDRVLGIWGKIVYQGKGAGAFLIKCIDTYFSRNPFAVDENIVNG